MINNGPHTSGIGVSLPRRGLSMTYERALETSDLFQGLSVVHFKLYGIWNGINDFRTTGRTSLLFKINLTLSILYVLPFVSFQALWVFLVPVDLKTATFVYMNGVSAFQVLLKIVLFWYHLKDHSLLFNLLKVDFLASVPGHKRAHVNNIYRENARRCNLFSVLAFAGNVLTIITWMMMPGFDTEITGTGRKKILSGWYPVPYSKTPWYELVFGYEVVLLTWHGSLVSLYECVLLVPLVGLYAHFLALGYHISTLKKDDAHLVGVRDPNTYLNNEMRKILTDYQKLLCYAEELKRANNAVLTVTLGPDIGVLIIVSLYMLYGTLDALAVIKLLMYFSFAAIEITLICVCSSIVETASSEIGLEVYRSDWYKANRKFACAAQIIMIRSTRPVTLTAIKMYPVNLEILISIFRFIYSTVALLSKRKD